jgi:hypothetical protein
MIPKCTLLIKSARIIDITTFRDMHVGLPRGTFGFVICGLRHLVLPGRRHAASDACVGVGGGGGGSSSSMEPAADERDFLCAVPTLEEAQSWVVALQWASSLHSLSPSMMMNMESCWADVLEEDDDNEQYDERDDGYHMSYDAIDDLYADEEEDDDVLYAASRRRPRLPRHQNALQVMPSISRSIHTLTPSSTSTRTLSNTYWITSVCKNLHPRSPHLCGAVLRMDRWCWTSGNR